MIVKNIAAFQEHVTCAVNFDFELIAPYIKTQERQYIKPVLGNALYAAWSEEVPVEVIPKEVFDRLEEASSNLAMLDYSNVGVIHIGNGGFYVSTSKDAVPASYGQLKDLRRRLLKAGNKAFDEALQIMENNEGEFPQWVDSTGYTQFKELFIRQTSEFQRHYNIDNSRLTFLRLRPHLLKVEDKYFEALLGAETVFQIKHGIQPEEKKALKLCQAAQVSLCVAELANEGAFAITPNGLVITSEELPGETYNRLPARDLENFARIKFSDGNEYLKKLIKYLQENEEKFVQFFQKETATRTSPVHNTKSIISF